MNLTAHMSRPLLEDTYGGLGANEGQRQEARSKFICKGVKKRGKNKKRAQYLGLALTEATKP